MTFQFGFIYIQSLAVLLVLFHLSYVIRPAVLNDILRALTFYIYVCTLYIKEMMFIPWTLFSLHVYFIWLFTVGYYIFYNTKTCSLCVNLLPIIQNVLNCYNMFDILFLFLPFFSNFFLFFLKLILNWWNDDNTFVNKNPSHNTTTQQKNLSSIF